MCTFKRILDGQLEVPGVKLEPKPKTRHTRSHNQPFTRPPADSLKVYASSFLPDAIRRWNLLPSTLVEERSQDIFSAGLWTLLRYEVPQ